MKRESSKLMYEAPSVTDLGSIIETTLGMPVAPIEELDPTGQNPFQFPSGV